jgi:hypothetical protein
MSLRISENVIWNETATGVSLYHTETGEFRTLNETAAHIWVLVADGTDRAAVSSRLSLLFAPGDERGGRRIRGDVDSFLDTMLDQGLLEAAAPAA